MTILLRRHGSYAMSGLDKQELTVNLGFLVCRQGNDPWGRFK